MASSDLTMREVFQQLIDFQNKGLAVQKDTAVALQDISESIDRLEVRTQEIERTQRIQKPLFSSNNKLQLVIAVGGWILAALALGVQGVTKLATLFGF